MIDKIKRYIATIMLIVILMASLPIQTFAVFITNINSNATFGVVSGSLNEYGHEMHYANYDGTEYLLFCTQYGKKSPTGKEYSYNGDFLAQYKEQRMEYEKIAEMIYFGYTMKYGMGLPNDIDSKKAACATQQYVWEYITNNIDSATTAPARDSWNESYMTDEIYNDWLSQTEELYNQYHSKVSFNDSNNAISIGEEATYTDLNGVLAHYSSFNETIDGVTFSHQEGSNILQVNVSENVSNSNILFSSMNYDIYELMPNGNRYDSSTMSNYVYFQFTNGTVQDLMFSAYVDPSSFNISISIESGSILLNKTDKEGNAIAGCSFELFEDEECTKKVGSGITNEQGKITFDKLKIKKYYVKEVSVPEGYLIDTLPQQVNVQNGETTTVNFKNDEPTGEMNITKTDIDTGNENRCDGTSHHGDASLNGTEYTLYASEDIYNKKGNLKYFSNNEPIAKFTFNEYGVANVSITNSSTLAEISVNGNSITGLPMGNYYLKETIVPEGYRKDENTYNYNISYKDNETSLIKVNGVVKNTVKKAPFEVIKVTTNDNTIAETVEGAEFTAILSKYVNYYGSFEEAKKHLNEFAKDEYSIFKTGSNGHGTSGLLAYGEYTVNETYTPSPEIETVEQFYVTIDKDSRTPIKELVANDLPFESYIKIQKKDKKTGKFVTYSNATFELYRLNEDDKKWEQVQCKVGNQYYKAWTTNKDGIARTETKLEAGNYKLEEIKIPTGFIELDEEIEFKVDNRNSTLNYDKDFDAWITVTAENEQPTGTLKLDKKVVLRENMDKTMIDNIDFTQISFELVAKENIIDYADGTTVYQKGQVVGKYNLEEDGTLTVSNLPMGKYYLKELTTIDGAVLDETEHEVVFKQTDTSTREYIVDLSIENETTAIEISKTDITEEKELIGAKLIITDENNEVIDSWVSTENTHKIEGLKVGQSYTMTEEIAPEGYVIATAIQFVVENTAEIQKVKMIDKVVEMTKEDIGGEEIEGAELKAVDKNGNVVDSWISTKEPHKIKGLTEGESYILYEEYAPDGFVISNEVKFTVTDDKETQKITMIDKMVEISKVNIAGEELEGATLVVTNTKTKNIVDKWISTKEPHKIKGLTEGESYILYEEYAPDGLVISNEVEFTVTNDKETQKIEMVDKVVEVVKTDLTTGEEIEGAELQVIDEDGNVIDEWVSTKEAHKVKGLEENKKYKLIEKTAPYGYELTEEIEFTVTIDKETQKIEMKDMPILKDIRVIKIDSETKEEIKEKFTFGIYEDKGCTKLIGEMKANKEDGFVTFEDLRYGTYYIKETKAPNGYELSNRVAKVEINDKSVFVDDTEIKEENEVYSFEFENQKIETPKTRR